MEVLSVQGADTHRCWIWIGTTFEGTVPECPPDGPALSGGSGAEQRAPRRTPTMGLPRDAPNVAFVNFVSSIKRSIGRRTEARAGDRSLSTDDTENEARHALSRGWGGYLVDTLPQGRLVPPCFVSASSSRS